MGFILAIILTISSFVLFISTRTAAKEDKHSGYSAHAPEFYINKIAFGLLVMFVLLCFMQLFTVIPNGSVGIVDIFGNINDKPLTSGINMVNPFANVTNKSIQTVEVKEEMETLSKEGLTIGLEISLIYHLTPDKMVANYRTISDGDVQNIIVAPQFRSITRAITARFPASSLYGDDREKLAVEIHKEMQKIIDPYGGIIESTPLRKVRLPEKLTAGIEAKQVADQESQRMQFTLTKEKQEADRKRIEAQGIADFQRIVRTGIDKELLQWKGIEATEILAKSPNSKIVIIGGKDGLPLILNQ
jgi:regulator of protease activity HflC (stomatin/prohibitin superfamily)